MYLLAKLVNGEELEFEITQNICVIGRSSKCDVVIPHEGMSRQHCQIENADGEIFVTDLGSTNGVHIDGQRIEPHKKVSYATYLSLSFGAVQNLTIDLEGAPSGSIKNSSDSADRYNNTSMKTTVFVGKTQTTPVKETQGTSPEVLKAKPKADTKEKSKTFMVNAMAILIVLAAVYWYATKEDSPVEDFTPKSSGPKTNANKNYEAF